MAALPKKRLYRAIYKAGLADKKQLDVINRKLGNDRKAQQRFEELWRVRMGHRFIGSLNAFASWVKLYWPEIKIALGIVLMFLDEEPEEVAKEAKEKDETPKYVAPPKPKRTKEVKKDEVPELVIKSAVMPAESVDVSLDALKEINKVEDSE